MALGTYSGLKAAVADWAARSDLTTQIEDFLDMAESRAYRRLRLRSMESRSSLTATAGSRYIALPDGFIEMRRLTILSGSERFDLEYVSPEQIAEMGDPASGKPKRFTVTSEIELDRPCDSAYTVEILYFGKLTALSGSNTTNILTTTYPEVLLYGTLTELYKFTRDNDEASKYDALFQNAIDDANKEDNKGRFGPAPALRMEVYCP